MPPTTVERWLHWITSGVILLFVIRGLFPWITPEPLYALPALFIAGVIAMLSHELSHVLAARMVGLRLIELGLGPVRIYWNGRKLRLSRSPRNPMGAYFIPVPIDDHKIRERFLVSMAGGPAGNLVVGLVAYVLYLLTPNRNPPTSGLEVLHSAAFFFLATSLVCIASVAANLLPFRGSSKDGTRDGKYLIDFMRGGPQVERLCALARVDGQNRVLGKMPEEWDSRRVDEATRFQDASPSTLLALSYAYLHTVDNDVERAGNYLDQALEILDERDKKEWGMLYGLKAVFEAYHRDNLESAREWVARAGSDLNEYMRHEIAAVFFLKEGSGAEALEQIQLSKQSYLTETKREGVSGVARSAARWFAKLEAEARALAQNASPTSKS